MPEIVVDYQAKLRDGLKFKIRGSPNAYQSIAYNYDVTDYLTFQVATMKTADNYGRSHSVYYNYMDAVADAPAKNGRKPRKLKKLEEVNEPLPF